MPDEPALRIGATSPGRYGPPSGEVTLAETSWAAAWNVQGRPERPALAETVARQFNVSLPMAPNTAAEGDAVTALWLGPASWLLVARGAPFGLEFGAARDALNAAGGALFELTSSRVAWTISGARAATVLAKHCPLDFHVRAFPERTCAQSVFGHVNALLYRREGASAFTLIVARSFAHDIWHMLCHSSMQYGYDIVPPREF